nr:MAG: hypothetical protein [Sichuan sediment noda-like virus 1]
MVNRMLIDKTKTPIEVHFYPLDSIRDINPTRVNDNGHPVSGAVRDAARRLIDEAIQVAGGRKYEINPSVQSESDSRNHFHYAVGDLKLDFSDEVPDGRSYIVGIDIDYYLTDPNRLLQYNRPLVLHTFNPIVVGGYDGDSIFTITDNIVSYKVSGGAHWNHAVWDWCDAGEFIASHKIWPWYLRWLDWLGLEKITYHKIHHARPWTNCPNRALVYTIPQFTSWRIRWIQSDINVRELKRVQYSDQRHAGWNRIEYVGSEEVSVSIGRQGEMANVSIPRSRLEVLQGLTTQQSVTSRMIGMGYKEPEFMSLVCQYFTGKVVSRIENAMIFRPTMPKVHWPITCDADIAEVSARQYTNPILSDSMMMPMIRRWEVLSESIERRVTHVQNDRKPSNQLAGYVKEFVQLLNHGVVDLHPLSIEDTIDRLNKPSQQLQLRAVFETLDMKPRELIESFNKNEPGMKSSRIISGFPDILFILKVSRYTLAYTDMVLKNDNNRHWYCPGLNPIQIAEKVVDFAVECDGAVIETDFSNLDGRVSSWMQRNVAQRAMVQAFAPQYTDEIRSIMDAIINCPARSKSFGFRYDPGVGVKSGSPTTTPHNTLYNGVIDYSASRMTYPEISPEHAFMMIGPKSGDDGLSRTDIGTAIDRVSRGFGLVVKIERYNPEAGLCFLSRVFIDPMVTTTSMQDPLRTLKKLHLTSRDPTIPLADAALDRVEGYLCTDSMTPVISDYCKMVRRLYLPHASSDTVRFSRKSVSREKPYWLTCDGSWPQTEAEAPLMREIISFRTGIDWDQYERILGRFASMKDVWEPISLETSEPSAATSTLDVDGQPVEGSVDESFTELNNAKQIRATPTSTGQSGRCNKGSVDNGIRRRTNKRAARPQQFAVQPGENQTKDGSNGRGTVTQTKCASISRGEGTTTKGGSNRTNRGSNSYYRREDQTRHRPNGGKFNRQVSK